MQIATTTILFLAALRYEGRVSGSTMSLVQC